MEINALSSEEGRAALEVHIDHIVVLMLENRSFDHMLGFLTIDGRDDVDGLDLAVHHNIHKGRRYPVWPLDRTALAHWEDPDHSGCGVERQMAGNNGGFVTNYIETRPPDYRPILEESDNVIVMGYFPAEEMPAYDHLASNFLICDRWFASVPGATWPNRLYALCGESGGSKDNKKKFGKIDWPLYHFPSFVRYLDKRDIDWRWYHARPGDVEPPTIQIADARYLWRFWEGGHYALIDRRETTGQGSFLDDARDGRLPPVAWIDPDFGITKRDLANDDHPPADIRRGQTLVRTVCNALMEGPKWDRTLLVITYDEHGGFYDHVPPPAAPDDREKMRRYGPRVPAIVVSPYVEASSVCRLTFDHTSIIRTVLQRFCREKDSGRVPSMGARVDNAIHLGRLLTLDEPRPPAPVAEFEGAAEALMPEDLELEAELQRHYATPRPASVTAEPVLDYEANLPPMNDLQLGLVRAGLERRDMGAPPDTSG